MFSATFLRPAKHIPPKSKGLQREWRSEEVVSWLVLFLNSFQPPQHTNWHVCCSTVFIWAGKKGERGERRATCRNAYFLNFFFFLCLLLTDQSKRKLEGKTHRARETKQNKQVLHFLEQNKLLGTATQKKNAIFNVNLQFHILLFLLGYKKISIFLNRTSRKKKRSESISTPGPTTPAGKTIHCAWGMFLDGLKINLQQSSATFASLRERWLSCSWHNKINEKLTMGSQFCFW